MAVISWFEGLPSNDSEVQHGDDEFRSLKSTIRTALAVEHEWASSSGTQDAGAHRPGSARPFYDVQSNLSASHSSRGHLYVASDTSRLFYTPVSGATQFVGSFGVPEILALAALSPTAIANYPGQNIRWVIETGTNATNTSAFTIVNYANTYAVAPTVIATSGTSTDASAVHYPVNATIRSNGITSFQVWTHGPSGNSVSATVRWMSLGTLAF